MDELTEKERQVLAYLAEGKTFHEIGMAVDRTRETIIKHWMPRIYAKLGVEGHRKMVKALLIAQKKGII